VEDTVNGVFGGIRSLLSELHAHGEAISFDLMSRGWTRHDIGSRLTWTDLYHFLRWMPPTGDSAYYRARKPNSWWVTPDLQILGGVLYALEAANWQRGGCQGNAPKPIKFPVDKEFSVKDTDDLNARRERVRRRRG
jgi:hypothetical protein